MDYTLVLAGNDYLHLPLSTVRGGASPTPDLRELAKRDDVSAYAAERRRQQTEDRRR